MKRTLKKATVFLYVVIMTVCLMTVSLLAEESKPLDICIITSDGVNDGSFNQEYYKGIQTFLNIHEDCKVTEIEEPDYDQLIPTLEKSLGDFDVFVLPGYRFSEIGDIVLNDPDQYFIVGATIQDSKGNPVTADNVYTMTFKEQEGGFFAGLAAALSTKTNKVAVVNGKAFPSNVNYEYGFMSGVNYANVKYGTKAEIIELPAYAGKDLAGNNVGGNYVGDFGDEAAGKEIGEKLIDAGCDVIFAAAGASGNGVFTAAREAGDVYVIGCDVDRYDDGVIGSGNIVLTSTIKVIDTNVEKQLEAIYDGTFVGENALLSVVTDSVGFVSEEGRQQLSADTIEKMNKSYELMKAGIIIPASCSEYTSDDFPGLK